VWPSEGWESNAGPLNYPTILNKSFQQDRGVRMTRQRKSLVPRNTLSSARSYISFIGCGAGGENKNHRFRSAAIILIAGSIQVSRYAECIFYFMCPYKSRMCTEYAITSPLKGHRINADKMCTKIPATLKCNSSVKDVYEWVSRVESF
jgi:hypothetical protein